MDFKEWAKKEIELACKREAPDRKEDDWDYGCACYESAYKAFESLCEDGHSGFSIQMTKTILNRLIDGKPLLPITDNDFFIEVENPITESEEYLEEHNMKSSIQCPRMSSLFRTEYKDGKIKYHDVDRLICININDNRDRWYNGFISNLLDELYPIEMPYMPSDNKIEVYCEEFLTDKKNGDFDTLGVIYLIKDDEHVNINRYFKGDAEDTDWVEINEKQYLERKEKSIRRE